MKNFEIVLNFRRDFLHLEYRKNKLTVSNLRDWVKKWCTVHNIPVELEHSFCSLAIAYAEKEWQEHYIPMYYKKHYTLHTRQKN